MKVIEFNVDALSELGSEFAACVQLMEEALQLEDKKANATTFAERGRDTIAALSCVLLLADAKYVSQLTFDKEDDYAYKKQVHYKIMSMN